MGQTALLRFARDSFSKAKRLASPSAVAYMVANDRYGINKRFCQNSRTWHSGVQRVDSPPREEDATMTCPYGESSATTERPIARRWVIVGSVSCVQTRV
jgi:hypothetical protein